MSEQNGPDLFGLAASDFGDDFTWGVATASYQIEGAWDEDGKGRSIWDTFTHRTRQPIPTVLTGENGDEACDFYHRYESDLELMGSLGVGANRFSVSWPRILPDGTGRVNEAGLDFYSRVVDATLANGMVPWLTCYHWDLPQALQDRGGWTTRDIVGWFEEYVGVLAERLGDRVKHWMIFNEPLSFVYGGYLMGAHAPGIISVKGAAAAVHHVNLCQAAGAAAIRARVADATVGTTHVISPMHTASPMGLFQEAKRKADALAHGVFLEPGFGMGYPQDAGLFVDHVERNVRPGDEEAMTVDFDFIGAQYYASMRAIPVPVVGALPLRLPLDKGTDRDQMGHWNNPDGLYDAIAVVNRYDRCPRIVVTENGASFPDVVEGAGDDARVHDLRRIDYLRKHLGAVARAKADGMPVDGYFYWSFMDNFEWALGYRPRFGLVHVDFATKARVVKDSGRWFRAFLAS